jgi:hypothetical protein
VGLFVVCLQCRRYWDLDPAVTVTG